MFHGLARDGHPTAVGQTLDGVGGTKPNATAVGTGEEEEAEKLDQAAVCIGIVSRRGYRRGPKHRMPAPQGPPTAPV